MPNPLTRPQIGELIFAHIKSDFKARGFSLYSKNFDPDYPISLRTIRAIRRGVFTIETLRKVPGVNVQELFEVGIN